METNEYTGKVMGPYIGQNVITRTRGYIGEKKTSSFLRGVLKDIDLGMSSDLAGVLLENEVHKENYVNYQPGNDCKLILKPINEITDSEAADIGYLFFNGITPSYAKILGVQILYTHFNILESQPVQINDLNEIEQISAYGIIKLYQYLQSRGYDFPQHLLDDKTLEQSNLAVYE